MKIFHWISNNILFILTLFLLAFIPLYPKLPILDVQHTWVYFRLEDFFVAFIVLFWFVLLLFKKVTLKTPLTLPILLFWIIGGIATLHGVLLIFPTISNVFSNVAFLNFLRRIEYMSLFFIAFFGIKNIESKKYITWVAVILTTVLLLVVAYGFGQRFLGFPAFLTMNEEFAKGIPIQLSKLSRVPSTFAGHYDLAAYLVLIIPIIVSLVFGFKNWMMKIFLSATALLGFFLLLMTVSRVSFFVLLLSLVLILVFHKKKFEIVSLFVLTIALLSFSPSLLHRYGNTVSEIDVLVDAKTGRAIGQVKEVPASYFKNKVVVREFSDEDSKNASSSVILPFSQIPSPAMLVVEPNSPNGENLPQGTSYINLPLSPIVKKVGEYFFQKSQENKKSESADAHVFFGDFVVKKAKAYDLSFTTRFQGEWPRTMEAFERNVFLGSGYGSVSLAVDNDYLRSLGETGLLGFISFISIFLIAGIYIKKIISNVNSPLIRSFVFGFVAGTFGLALNALFIDVFEASKIAFSFWLLMGITIGVLSFYEFGEINLLAEFKKIVTSTYAIIAYLFILTFTLFSGVLSYYFAADDFTWLRWAADCNQCRPLQTILNYFTQSNGFFYRPGTKLYFDLMYSGFWLNQTIYHLVSIFLHFTIVLVIFFLSRKILKNLSLAAASAFLFVILSGYSETIFWVASTGHLFNALFALTALLFFILWKEKGRTIYFALSFVSVVLSLLFHELGVVAPFLIILYDLVFERSSVFPIKRKVYFSVLAFPIIPYLFMRFISESHWLNGDYSYNILKLPFNFIGNVLGYLVLTLLGPSSLGFYEKLRNFSKGHLVLSFLISIIIFSLFVFAVRKIFKKVPKQEKNIVIFGFLFFVISLLPFLGLGNITSRYSYLSSFGIVILLVLFLKKIYYYLLGNGAHIAVSIIILITIVFGSAHLFQSQKIQTDWSGAGDRTKNFLTSLDWVYAHYPRDETKRLFFVDVPIKNGDAWVFPVGLDDAVWLILRNENVKVYKPNSVEQAFDWMGATPGKVFQFTNDGSLVELRKTQSGTIVPIPIRE